MTEQAPTSPASSRVMSPEVTGVENEMSSRLVLGIRRMLVADPVIPSLVGSSPEWATWIFRWRTPIAIEGTGQCAIEISQRGSWSGSNQHNSMRFPRVHVMVWADAERASDLNPSGVNGGEQTVEERALYVAHQVDRLMHRPASDQLVWGDVRVLNSFRLADPEINEVPGGDGLMTCTTTYGVTVG